MKRFRPRQNKYSSFAKKAVTFSPRCFGCSLGSLTFGLYFVMVCALDFRHLYLASSQSVDILACSCFDDFLACARSVDFRHRYLPSTVGSANLWAWSPPLDSMSLELPTVGPSCIGCCEAPSPACAVCSLIRAIVGCGLTAPRDHSVGRLVLFPNGGIELWWFRWCCWQYCIWPSWPDGLRSNGQTARWIGHFPAVTRRFFHLVPGCRTRCDRPRHAFNRLGCLVHSAIWYWKGCR